MNLNELKKISKKKEKILETVVKTGKIFPIYDNDENFIIFGREWNSWYPSALNVSGGAYIININQEIILIDPGFGTIDLVKKNNLDIRKISHVFITHLHPDHTENLTKILTKLTSESFPLKVYLNSTSFSHFQKFARSGQRFFECKPCMKIKLKFSEEMVKFTVNVSILPAYHQEVGGAFGSISLKFNLIPNNLIKVKMKPNSHLSEGIYLDQCLERISEKYGTKIGFLSDTDGLYFKKYIELYKDCDIIVPHLGSLHGDPKGYKHLYKDGLTKFLRYLPKKKDRLIVISEFGFELSNSDEFYEKISEILPREFKFHQVMNRYYHLLKESHGSLDEYVGTIFSYILFEKFIEHNMSQISLWFFLPQIIDHFFSLDESNIRKLNLKNNNLTLYSKISDVESIFLKTIEHGLFYENSPYSSIDLEREFNILFKSCNLTPFQKHFDQLFDDIWKYISPISKKKLHGRLTISIFPQTIDFASFLGYYKSHNLLIIPGGNKHPINFWKSAKMMGHQSKYETSWYYDIYDSLNIEILILLFHCYFLFKLSSNDMDQHYLHTDDLRPEICKNYSKLSGMEVLMSHPSYRIQILENEEKFQYISNCQGCNKEFSIKKERLKEWIYSSSTTNQKISFGYCQDCAQWHDENYLKWEEKTHFQNEYEEDISLLLNHFNNLKKSGTKLHESDFPQLTKIFGLFEEDEWKLVDEIIENSIKGISDGYFGWFFSSYIFQRYKDIILIRLDDDSLKKKAFCFYFTKIADHSFYPSDDSDLLDLIKNFFRDSDLSTKINISNSVVAFIQKYEYDIKKNLQELPNFKNFIFSTIFHHWFNQIITLFTNKNVEGNIPDHILNFCKEPKWKECGYPFTLINQIISKKKIPFMDSAKFQEMIYCTLNSSTL